MSRSLFRIVVRVMDSVGSLARLVRFNSWHSSGRTIAFHVYSFTLDKISHRIE